MSDAKMLPGYSTVIKAPSGFLDPSVVVSAPAPQADSNDDAVFQERAERRLEDDGCPCFRIHNS